MEPANGVSSHLKALVAKAPKLPGCYIWKDAQKNVLYVGKAKNLRARLKQYVNLDDTRPQVPRLMKEASSFDYIVVDSEHEALVLEINLIQHYHPPFNVSLMDDKSYPFIALTLTDRFPALKYTREKHRQGTLYYGPYTDARAARSAIDIVRKVCPLCVATCAEWKRVSRNYKTHPKEAKSIDAQLKASGRPCFDFHVGKGPGVCVGAISKEAYAELVEITKHFLEGKHKPLITLLAKRREMAARELDFEKAARYQARIDTIQALDGEQQVYFPQNVDVDICGIWREVTIAAAFVFAVREGRVVRTVDFILTKGNDVGSSELLSSFLQQYYSQTNDIPPVIEVPYLPDDQEALETWLRELNGKKTQLKVPKRGHKAKLLETASRNARHALMRYELKTGYEDKRINRALLELESALALEEPPLRIECFDISTIHGSYTVASMVVFENGKPNTSQYRRFKIKAKLREANDFLSMEEVISRRYSKERMSDKRFGRAPDLIVVDGGLPQLTAATRQLKDLGINIPVVGLAKADEELFVTFQKEPVVLPQGSTSLYLIKQVRDEAHRFAITYHRELRAKAMTASILDEIEGVGPKRKRALLKKFGSLKQLKQASVEDLASVSGISQELAQEIVAALQIWDRMSKEPALTYQNNLQ